MAKKTGTEIITVQVSRVKNTSDTFSVYLALIENGPLPFPVTVKQFAGPVRQMQRWCLAGTEVLDPRWGTQFVAQFATLAAPRTDREMMDFLCSGLVEGWDMGKADLLRSSAPGGILARYLAEPEWLSSVEGITPEMMSSLRAAFARAGGMAAVYAQLVDWGCTGRQSEALVKYYGFATIEKLTQNPYADLLDINGYGWKTAENIARCLGISAEDPRRIKAGIETAVHEATWQEGSTWLDEKWAVGSAAILLDLPAYYVAEEIDAAVADGRLVRDGTRIYPEALYLAEERIAEQIAQRVVRPGLCEESRFAGAFVGTAMSFQQVKAILQGMCRPLSLLTGGPGTGKTTCLRTLIDCARGEGIAVTCMAPTGKAAARMTEATGVKATTIHSRLGIVPGQYSDPDDLEPVTGLVIVDEVSMLDTSLCAQMFSRISLAAQILLVGDPDQLPSVGPGAVLRDLIAADVLPRVHLDHVYRNDAGIAVNAGRMRDGKDILSLPDCEIVPQDTPDAALSMIASLAVNHRAEGHPGDELLILTPTNDGPCGRYALNQLLQPMLNDTPAQTGIVQYAASTKDPDGTLRKRSEELRRGDRVMVTRNNRDLAVFNGQIGTVVDVVVPRSLDVEIDGEVKTFSGEDKRLLTLAYAITGHKSQGSEAPHVIVPVFKSRVLSREWLYTVMTRAKETCTLIGDPAAIQACIRVQRCNDRQTGLVGALDRAMGVGE